MTRKAGIETLQGESATGRDKSFLEMLTFLGFRGEFGFLWEDQPVLFGLIDGSAVAKIEYT